jgi:hypothetical protein
MKSDEQGPFRPEVVDRNADIVEPKLPCENRHLFQATTTSVPLISTISPSKAG